VSEAREEKVSGRLALSQKGIACANQTDIVQHDSSNFCGLTPAPVSVKLAKNVPDQLDELLREEGARLEIQLNKDRNRSLRRARVGLRRFKPPNPAGELRSVLPFDAKAAAFALGDVKARPKAITEI
jgi:hypothetical protein